MGSGDIGLIMARRMTLEGAKVEAVCELLPYSGGLTRNIVQCLNDFGIPLKLSHTITEIHGKDRVTGVTVCAVDERRNPIPETAEYIECDTVLLSVGLIPENELSKSASVALDPVTNGAVVNEYRETNIPGIFACGNVLHVHDLVDFVSEEAELAGIGAARFIQNGENREKSSEIPVKATGGVRYVVPQKISCQNTPVKLFFRVANVYKNVIIEVKDGDTILLSRKKQKVAPGEMESLVLSPELMQKIQHGAVTVTLSEQGQKEGF